MMVADIYEERTRGRKKSDYALALDRLKCKATKDNKMMNLTFVF